MKKRFKLAKLLSIGAFASVATFATLASTSCSAKPFFEIYGDDCMTRINDLDQILLKAHPNFGVNSEKWRDFYKNQGYQINAKVKEHEFWCDVQDEERTDFFKFEIIDIAGSKDWYRIVWNSAKTPNERKTLQTGVYTFYYELQATKEGHKTEVFCDVATKFNVD